MLFSIDFSFAEATEKPEKIKEDPPADPSTAKIVSNKESIIEINANNKGLGLFVAGGKMLTPPVVSINMFAKNISKKKKIKCVSFRIILTE